MLSGTTLLRDVWILVLCISHLSILACLYTSPSHLVKRESRHVEQKYTLCVLVDNLYAMHLTPHMVITGDGAPKIALAQCMREKDMACAHCFHLSNLLMLLSCFPRVLASSIIESSSCVVTLLFIMLYMSKSA